MDVIILSGGLGKRLRSIVKDIPKTMAKVNERPFLEHTLKYISQFDVQNVILAVGYKREYIKKYFKEKFLNMNIIYSEETEPLGTGGAIKKALKQTSSKNIIVMNGDIYHKVNLKELMESHLNSNRPATLTLKEMKDFDRFGVVEFDENNIITAFKEKEYTKKGYINVGVYAVKNDIFDDLPFEEKFSIENDYFNKYANQMKFNAYIYDKEFIDIGIPEDYQKCIQIFCNKILNST